MGANKTQGTGVLVFLAGFTVLCAGLANDSMLLDLLGVVLVAVSAGVFMKAKPWEHAE